MKSLISKTIKIDILLLFLIFLLNSQIFSQNNSNNNEVESWESTKPGGISFRINDNYPIDSYLSYADIFQKWSYNFSFAIGLGFDQVDSDGYIDGIKRLQQEGNELLDPTPNFRTNYFFTKFDLNDYSDLPGVDHIIDNKICLKFDEIDFSKKIKEGYLDLYNNQIYGEQQFAELNQNNVFIFFPEIDTLVLVNELIGNDLYSITDIWNEPVNLGVHLHTKYFLFSKKDIKISDDAIVLLGNESVKLANSYNLVRPYTWIQPGGHFPYLTRIDIKDNLGDFLDYSSGSVFPPYHSIKTYNEFNPNKDKNFGMQWGDFQEDRLSLNEIKTIIADGIARHRVMISHTTFGNAFDNFLQKTDSLLEWCSTNNIPVKTHSEWSNILYNTIQNPYINIFPKLNVDLDNNGYPDGYSKKLPNYISQLDTLDGVQESGNISFTVNSQKGICYIANLGGIEKGPNSFEFWSKGEEGDSIEVVFVWNSEKNRFKFPAESSNWKKYNLNNSANGNTHLMIPDSISLLDIYISCSNHSSGDVKISGMSLRSAQPDTVSPSPPENIEGIGQDNKAIISWLPNQEEDIEFYRLYKSQDPLFDPDTLTSSIYTTSDTFYVDTDVEVGQMYYYKVSAFDFVGNKSDYSPIVSVFITTDVAIDNQLPNTFELLQNFPNPFNPTTNIKFALPKRSNVKLSVYNAIGQEVSILINSTLAAGYHTIEFDANNLSSGIYFYRISAGNFVTTRKMMLLK